MLVDSILDAILTVSPNKQYRGLFVIRYFIILFNYHHYLINLKIFYIFKPTTPATTGPLWHPKHKIKIKSVM